MTLCVSWVREVNNEKVAYAQFIDKQQEEIVEEQD